MYIYADFNGLTECEIEAGDGVVRLDLTGYGTLAYLSHFQVRLHVGQRIALADSDGLVVDAAEVIFDRTLTTDRCSGWFAKFHRSDIRQGATVLEPTAHHCFKCRTDLRPHLDKVGRNFKEICPSCGTPVMYPLLPPGQ